MFRNFLLKNMWAIRLYIDRFLNQFTRPQPCIVDEKDIKTHDDRCEQYCTHPSFKDARLQNATINGKTLHICCPKGYTPEVVKNPITRKDSHVICRKS